MVSAFILLQSQLLIAKGSICHLFSHRGCGQSWANLPVSLLSTFELGVGNMF